MIRLSGIQVPGGPVRHCGKSGPFAGRPRDDRESIEMWYDTINRTELAFHEAGHVVANFLIGDLIDYITMRRTRKWLAGVKCRGNGHHPELLKLRGANDQLGARRAAAACILGCLSGPCVELLRSGDERPDPQDECPSWADNLLFGMHWHRGMETRANGLSGMSDAAQALWYAESVHGSDAKRADAFIHRIARWTEELMTEPRVLRTVEAIAERLTKFNRVEGGVAHRVMAEAWGDDRWRGAPMFRLHELGTRWHRRFLCHRAFPGMGTLREIRRL